MLKDLQSHPNANAVLAPVLEVDGAPSHAYLFHGPGGSGKRRLAREIAATLLSQGAGDQASAHARALAGTHPDLTWVVPSGAHEILVSDIAEPVIAAASKTPFESSRRVFVIESADQLGDQAANRMLKTLEEPASFVHMILITDRLADVLPTIRSRCQVVRFDAPSSQEVADDLVSAGVEPQTAHAYARLSFGDAAVAHELAAPVGGLLRERAQELVRQALGGDASAKAPWTGLLEAVKARGERVNLELTEQATAEIAMYPRKEQKRVEGEWADRVKRGRRRVETEALELALSLAESWLLDLASLAWGATDLVRNSDRLALLESDAGIGRGSDPQALRAAVELIEDTRLRLPLNVSEELACEALTYRVERVLAS